MTQAYQHNYRNDISGKGREIRISDGTIGYCYPLADSDTIEDALDSFEASYDYNLDPDDDPRDVVVCLEATQYQDGEVVCSRHRSIRPEC